MHKPEFSLLSIEASQSEVIKEVLDQGYDLTQFIVQSIIKTHIHLIESAQDVIQITAEAIEIGLTHITQPSTLQIYCKAMIKSLLANVYRTYPQIITAELINQVVTTANIQTADIDSDDLIAAIAEAGYESYIDLVFMQTPANLSHYGISSALSPEQIAEQNQIVGQVKELIRSVKDPVFVSLLEGGRELAGILEVEKVVGVTLSTSSGTTLVDVNVDLDMINTLESHKLKQVIVLDDVTDRGATLTQFLIQLITHIYNDIPQLSPILDRLKQLYSRLVSPAMGEELEFNYHASQEFLSIINELREILGIQIIVSADKVGLLLNRTNLPNLPLWSLSQFTVQDSGEIIDPRQRPWLMGLGMDTKISVRINGLVHDISVGRLLDSIVKLEPNHNGISGFERMQQFVVNAIGQYDPHAQVELI